MLLLTKCIFIGIIHDEKRSHLLIVTLTAGFATRDYTTAVSSTGLIPIVLVRSCKSVENELRSLTA